MNSEDTDQKQLQALIEDLEESIAVNNQFIADIINAKSKPTDSSESSLLIPRKAFELLQEENKRLQVAVERISTEEQQAVNNIKAEETFLLESKQRKREKNRQARESIDTLRKEVLDKEGKIQQLEAYAMKLEKDIERLEVAEPVKPQELIKEAAILLVSLEKEFQQVDTQKHQVASQCKQLEQELKVPLDAGVSVEAILAKEQLLDLNYETYWFPKSTKEVKVECKGKSATPALQEELLAQVQTEEIASIGRLLAMLESQKLSLAPSVEFNM